MSSKPILDRRRGSPAGADSLIDRFVGAWEGLDCPGTWRRLVVAVSGGPDSLALLHLLHQTRGLHQLELVVAHADHGIHPDSALVARRVAEAGARLGLPVVTGRLGLGAAATETTAREARHRWLESVRRDQGADAIVLAHHSDDQIETVLLRVLAGSGPAGLAGMEPRRGRLLRPLLAFSRAELVEWLAARGVESWTDPANTDPRHARSWIRTELLPLLVRRDPAVSERILRLARQAADDRRGWEEALGALPGLDLQTEGGRLSVDALALVRLDPALGISLLRAAARRLGFVLGARRAAAVTALLRRGGSGRRVELGNGWQAELAFGRLIVSRATSVPAPVRLAGPAGELRFGEWRVTWRPAPAPGQVARDGWTVWLIGEKMVIRPPAAGDRIRPLGGPGRRAVSRLLQEARVPRSRRATWPLLEVDGQVVWVAGVCRGSGALPEPGAEAVCVEVHRG